ncbi:MAG TPA: DUF5668 domain-containing protein [Anaerolineae bacterium]
MEYHRRPSLIGPLILITLGVLFLLANFGMLPLSFWEIAARFWPLVLILVGLELVFGRRSAIGALVVVVLWLALVGGVVWLASAGGGVLPSAPLITETLSEPLGDIKSATINLDIGVATTNVIALGAEASDLMKGTFAHSSGIRIAKSYNVAANEGRLGLKGEGADIALFDFRNSRWDIGLNPGLPLVLNVNGGVGRVELDLSGLNVTAINLDAGVGTIAATTPSKGVTTLRVNGGVGNATITVPNGVSARIHVNSGLGAIRVNETRFPKAADGYQSSDYGSSANKIDIAVDGGVGSVDIR